MDVIGFKLIDDRYGAVWCVCDRTDFHTYGHELYKRQDVLCGVSDDLDEAMTDYQMNRCMASGELFEFKPTQIKILSI